MRRTCFYHAGCPDGFGAAWAVWRAWGDDARYVPRGHDDVSQPDEHRDETVVFVDIAPHNDELRGLAEQATEVTVLDHHVSSRERFASEPSLENVVTRNGHRVHFDLEHSGSVLAWQHFHPGRPVPLLLRYVEDQDLWRWQLPDSAAVNAAIGSYPRTFDTWSELVQRSGEALAREGAPLLRAQRVEIQRALQFTHPVAIGSQRVEAVNALAQRAAIGHELARRAAYGPAWGLAYRVVGDRVYATLYSIGELDVSVVAGGYGGGGHRNAAGFSVSLRRWLDTFVAERPAAE